MFPEQPSARGLHGTEDGVTKWWQLVGGPERDECSMNTQRSNPSYERCVRAGFQVKKTMVTVFFTATRLIVLNRLPQDQSFTQDYFISENVLSFIKEKLTSRRHHPGVTFPVHIDNSHCHNGRMATAEFDG
jgi:hypothetical protein